MTTRLSILSLASAATLALALAQPAAAEGEQAAPPAPAAASAPEAPAAAAPAAPSPADAPAAQSAPTAAEAAPAAAAEPVSPHAAAMQRMDQHRAEMNAERNRRYGELRERAAEVGIELPETPPWEQAEVQRPEMPAMPSDMGNPPMGGMSQAERRAQMERMRSMTQEERMAARAENYKQLRERAATQGIELPETPPWEQAEQRRKAMQEKWDSYRKQVEAMTEEQREAARAVFGGASAPDAPQMPMPMPIQRQMQMPMDMPMGGPMGRSMDMPMTGPMDMPMPSQGARGFGPGPCPQGDCGGMMPPRGVMPGWGGDQGADQTFPQQQGGYGMPWGRGY